jgi:hypothetical protein
MTAGDLSTLVWPHAAFLASPLVKAGGARRRHLRLEARLGPRLLHLAALVEEKKAPGAGGGLDLASCAGLESPKRKPPW